MKRPEFRTVSNSIYYFLPRILQKESATQSFKGQPQNVPTTSPLGFLINGFVELELTEHRVYPFTRYNSVVLGNSQSSGWLAICGP